MKKVIGLTIVLVLVGLTAVPTVGAQGFRPGDQTIAEIASSTGVHNTLVAALTCTGLVSAVANPDAEFTVFAPTDEAFWNTLGVTSETVCNIDNELLTNVLLYHVVDERRPSPSVIRGQNKRIEMLAIGSIYPEGRRSPNIVDEGGNTVSIIAADVLASNGIIHVIDGVLLPFPG